MPPDWLQQCEGRGEKSENVVAFWSLLGSIGFSLRDSFILTRRHVASRGGELMDWEERIERKIAVGMREWKEFQNLRFLRAFFLKHGREIIHASHDLLRHRINQQFELERRILDNQLKLASGLVPREKGGLVLAERDVEELASFTSHLAKIKRDIRENYPDEAEEIIGQFEDIIEMRLGGKG
jgi:hypothetical protein